MKKHISFMSLVVGLIAGYFLINNNSVQIASTSIATQQQELYQAPNAMQNEGIAATTANDTPISVPTSTPTLQADLPAATTVTTNNEQTGTSQSEELDIATRQTTEVVAAVTEEKEVIEEEHIAAVEEQTDAIVVPREVAEEITAETLKDLRTDKERVEHNYGIVAEHHEVYSDKVKKNQFLSSILTKQDISYQSISKAVNASEGVFDVRDLKIGQAYTILQDSCKRATHFIYESSAIDYIVYDFTDIAHINVYACEREIETRERIASGIIESSLWLTMTSNNINPVLAVHLSEVFAWTVDFFHTHKGDSFKAIYEEQFVDGKSVGISNIKAAYFKHIGKENYAFNYIAGEDEGFYDEEGQSVKKAFLKSPLKFSRISSRYSKRRFHPVLKRYKSHLGTDYAAPKGTPILAVGDGTVIAATYHRGNGRYVKIRHNGTYTTQYLHMSRIGKGIKRGSSVKQGQVIGYVGKTGLATGPHLCFRFWKNGVQVDPFKQKMPPSKPLAKKYLAQYQQHMNTVKPQLDAIPYPAPKVKTADTEVTAMP